MKSLAEIRETLAQQKEFLRRQYGVKDIFIFGSYSRKEATLQSDIDLLVEFERPIGWEIVDLKEYLENLLGIKVDLVSKKAVLSKPLLWKEIEKDLVNV